ncbi:MAG: tetratricopeptide repeat protein [Candidatus Obscuribacterales bacterium]|nr:tetratricopeptide repeat protein [Candidatus Obscuribacterales bacterium]
MSRIFFTLTASIVLGLTSLPGPAVLGQSGGKEPSERTNNSKDWKESRGLKEARELKDLNEPNFKVKKLKEAKRLLLSSANPQLARALADEVLQVYPNDIDAREMRGISNLKSRKFEEANRDFELTLKNADKLDKNKKANLLMLKGTASMDLCEAGRAVQELTEALSIKPIDAAYFNRATCNVQTFNYEAAIRDYTFLINHERKRPRVDFMRGRVHYLLGDYDHAIQDFTSGIKMSPNNASLLYLARGRAYQAKGMDKEALQDFNKGFLQSDDFAENHFMFSIDQSLSDTGSSAANRLTQSDNNYEAALKLKESGKLKEALVYLDRSIAQDPQRNAARVLKGNILLQLNRTAEALHMFDIAWTINNLDLEAVTGRSKANLALGKPNRALADIGKLIWASPDDATLYMQKGLLLEKLNQKIEAKQAFEKSLSLSAKNKKLALAGGKRAIGTKLSSKEESLVKARLEVLK